MPLIGPANAAVARYDGILSAIPNPDILLSPLTTQEAVLSSRIEGTQATMGEVLEFEARGDTEKPRTSKDWTFERPIFKGSDFIRSGNIPRPTAQRILNVLKKKVFYESCSLAAEAGRQPWLIHSF